MKLRRIWQCGACALGCVALLGSCLSVEDEAGGRAGTSGSSGSSGSGGSTVGDGSWTTGGTGAGGTGGVTDLDATSDDADSGPPPPSGVMVDKHASTFITSVGDVSLNWNHTVAPSENRLLFVTIHAYDNTIIKSVTAGTSAMSSLGSSQPTSSNYARIHFFGLLNPPPGDIGITALVTVDPSWNEVIGASTSFYNVSQTAPLGTFASKQSASASSLVSLDVASAPGELVVSAITHRHNTTPYTPGLGLQPVYTSNGEGGFDLWGAQSTGGASPTGATTTMTWTHPDSGYSWAVAGVSIRPVANS